MIYLFVGGPHDGKRVDVPTLIDRITLNVIPKPSFALNDDDVQIEDSVEFKIAVYKPFPFRADNKTFFIYALESMRALDVLEHLIAYYPERNS
jgi:hypothetical protein